MSLRHTINNGNLLPAMTEDRKPMTGSLLTRRVAGLLSSVFGLFTRGATYG